MKRMRDTRRWFFAIIGLAVIGIGLFQLSKHPVMRCYLVRWSGLDRIAANIYVDPAMSKEERADLLKAVSEAKERIALLYGDSLANPVVIAGHSMAVMTDFGGNSYNRVGRTFLTALGSYIVLGPDGVQDMDVIAHEIAHAELARRIGYRRANRLPDWFEEGLASQVDERFTEVDWQTRTANGTTAPNLEEIGTIKHADWLAYATAKQEVSRWLEAVGQDGLSEFLQMIRQGGDFASIYQPPPHTASLPNAAPMQVLPARLQSISVGNAAEVKILNKFEIPGFHLIHETCGVAFSPNGQYLAAACMSKNIPIWEIPSGELIYEFRGNQVWTGVVFSPDSKTLVSVGQSRVISFWNLETGQSSGAITRSPGSLNVPVFSSDGSKLIAGSFSGVATVWDFEKKVELVRFSGHNSRVNSVDFSPDGNWAASGGGDNLARVWNSRTGEEIFALSGPSYFVEDVEFSPDGEFLLGAADDGTIRIWELEEGKLAITLFGHDGPVNGIAYSPDGSLIASCGNDHILRLWDVETQKALARLVGHEDYAIRPAFSPDGTLIATIGWDGNLILWGVLE